MELKEAIFTRRSVRKYTEQIVEKEKIDTLIQAGAKAPSSMNTQPWAFSVIQDKGLLKEISDQAKEHLLSVIETQPQYEKYRDMLTNPNFHIFHNANTLLTIYAKPLGPRAEGDCSLAAQNIMLVAHDMGLGTCWIGFSKIYLNLPKVKEMLGVPEEYIIVAPIIIGYPEKIQEPIPKNEPQILFWK